MRRRTRYHSLLTFALLALCALPCHAHITKLPPAEKKHLLSDDFRVVTKTAQIPAAVRAEFCRIAKASEFSMADAGQPFQATDVIMNRDLPGRRLIFAGISHDRCVLFYERGGIAHTYTLALFRLSGAGKAAFVWGAMPQSRPTQPNLAWLRASLRADQWDDRYNYYW